VLDIAAPFIQIDPDKALGWVVGHTRYPFGFYSLGYKVAGLPFAAVITNISLAPRALHGLDLLRV
jgi:hypothetical protein